MLTALIVGGVVIMTIGSVVKRLLDMHAMSGLIWPLLLAAGSMPVIVCYWSMNPGDPVDSAVVTRLHDKVSLEIPAEGYALMVTATLSPEDPDDAQNGKTAYNLSVAGKGWARSAAGNIHRTNSGGGPDIDLVDGQGITETGRQRSGKWGEDLQDRFDFEGSGTAEIEVTNWQGTAARSLTLDVVKAPPPTWQIWIGVIVLSLLGLVFEVGKNAERVAGDVAFLALWGLFLRDGVTPLDDFQRVGWALAPAALLGWGAMGGIAWLALKYTSTKAAEAAEAEAEAEPEPEVEAPTEEQTGERRRRRRGPRVPKSD